MYNILGFDREALHQPPILLRGHFSNLIDVAGPPKLSGLKSFVQKQKSVAFPEQSFYSVLFSPAEKEKRVCPERIKFKLVLHQRREAVDAKPKIRVSTGDVDILDIGGIIGNPVITGANNIKITFPNAVVEICEGANEAQVRFTLEVLLNAPNASMLWHERKFRTIPSCRR